VINSEYYEEMYYKLFNKITDIIDALQTVQAETEEMFLRQEPGRETPQTADEGGGMSSTRKSQTAEPFRNGA